MPGRPFTSDTARAAAAKRWEKPRSPSPASVRHAAVFPPDLHAVLVKVARRTGLPLSAIIREACWHWLDKWEVSLMHGKRYRPLATWEEATKPQGRGKRGKGKG